MKLYLDYDPFDQYQPYRRGRIMPKAGESTISVLKTECKGLLRLLAKPRWNSLAWHIMVANRVSAIKEYGERAGRTQIDAIAAKRGGGE